MRLGFPQLQRSQIAMNPVSLCEGAISETLFLSLADNRPQFKDLLLDYHDLFSGNRECPSPRRVKQLEFSLRMTQYKLRKQCTAAKQESQICDVKEEEQTLISTDDCDDSLPKWWDLLRRQYATCERNLSSFQSTGVMNGYRYPDAELRKLYVLTSLSGKVFYNTLHRLFGFPCWDTVKEYRKQMRNETVTFEALDGHPSNVEALTSYFSLSGDDRRCVASIDATAVKCNFGVTIDGTVLGTVNPFSVSSEMALKMAMDQSEFDRFHEQHVSHIAKAVFVVIVNPLSVNDREFPVAVFAHHQGQMDDAMLQKLQDLNKTLKKLGFDVVGNGFDGDAKFTKHATFLCDAMMKLAAQDMTGTVKETF